MFVLFETTMSLSDSYLQTVRVLKWWSPNKVARILLKELNMAIRC